MSQNKNKNNNQSNVLQSSSTGTNPQKVKQEIQKDVSRGEGSMTAREAGSMRD